MNASHTLLILLALIGFFLLAAILLVPVYLFLKREKQVSEQWTPEALSRRLREAAPSPNGSSRPDAGDERAPSP